MKKIVLPMTLFASALLAGEPTASTQGLDAPKPAVAVESKAGLLKISGEHRITLTKSDKDGDNGKFSIDRTYLQVKAYFFEDPKSFVRITLDAKGSDGTYETYLKYSYLYLNDIVPHTGVEIGQVHKPWVDYEEHFGFKEQAVYGVFVDKMHVTNSADRGLNFKTKLENFSSEVGIFQGEGYKNTPDHADEGYSLDARATYHFYGTKSKGEYLNISLAGAANSKHNDLGEGGYGDKNWALVHAVYKNQDFLIAGQYLNVFKDETSKGDNSGEGYAINADYYASPKVTLFGRYDYFERDREGYEKENIVGGVAYKYNKNITFALSAIQNKRGDKDVTKGQALIWIKW